MDWHNPDDDKCASNENTPSRFLDYTHVSVRELCTNYGKIDVLWYDGPWPLDAEGLESVKMKAMVRELQPDIIINDRSLIIEDFEPIEQHITSAGEGLAWEACVTFNVSWDYTHIDTNFKNTWDVISLLRQVAAGGGNLLLNIGPTPECFLPKPCGKTLLEAG